jgi:hypothetical protein
MKPITLALAVLPFFAGSPALAAATITDPVGDFLPSFTGTASPDLDVTSFSVSLDSSATTFSLGAVLAGDINPALPGFYVIGIDTGSGTIAPFAGIGEPNVRFNQAILVQKNGTATLGANALTVLLSGNQFIVSVPVSLLPSTGVAPASYGFNLWPRDSSVSGTGSISDFAPNNALLTTSGVVTALPEPGTWLMMLLGFGLVGMTMRVRRDRRHRAIAQIA